MYQGSNLVPVTFFLLANFNQFPTLKFNGLTQIVNQKEGSSIVFDGSKF
jgi:hypothetical protein